MSAPPSGPDSPPNEEDGRSPGDERRAEESSPDPEAARREAEEALAEIEALADLDEETDPESGAADAPPIESSPSAPQDPPEDQCENCGALLEGPYCSQCGQKAADRIVPIWHLINEVLESLYQLDFRVLRTLPKFLFLPGRLTREYINGRRKRYIRPFRLYLFSTFLLFAVIAFTTTGNFGFVLDPQGMARLNPPNTAIAASSSPDTTAMQTESGAFVPPSERREQIANQIESDSTALNLFLYDDPEANERLERVLRAKIAQVLRNPWDFVNRIIDRGPYLLFLMLPIFALLLKLLYVRHGRLYAEHLIFSLHVHAFTFFAFTVGLLLEQSNVGGLNTAATGVEASPLLYLILALRHVYDQGLFKSVAKTLLLLLTYSLLLSIGFFALLFVVILLM